MNRWALGKWLILLARLAEEWYGGWSFRLALPLQYGIWWSRVSSGTFSLPFSCWAASEQALPSLPLIVESLGQARKDSDCLNSSLERHFRSFGRGTSSELLCCGSSSKQTVCYWADGSLLQVTAVLSSPLFSLTCTDNYEGWSAGSWIYWFCLSVYIWWG